MKVLAIVILVTLLLPLGVFAQKKETIELQRDVAILSDNVRTLQSSLDQKVAALTVLIQQTLDSVGKNSSSMSALDASLREQIKQQVLAPVANLSARMDQIGSDVQGLRGAVDDLNNSLKRLDAKLADIKALVEVTRAPATAPPPGTDPNAQPQPGGSAPPGISAQETYANAYRDKTSGNLDLALSEFNEFLKHFDKTELAPNAQFQVGDIYYSKGDYQNALAAFDLVLEKYPDNNKTPDALYMKGMTLLRSGQRTAAGKEFQELVRRFPSSDVAGKAKDQLKALGLRAAAPPAPAKAKKAAAKKKKRARRR
jgi:tol-pal system protein YbgF